MDNDSFVDFDAESEPESLGKRPAEPSFH